MIRSSQRWVYVPSAFAGCLLWLLLSAVVTPVGCLAESINLPNARDMLKPGTVEVGIAGGFWQAFDVGHYPPSTNRSAVFVLPKAGIIISDEFRAGLFSGNLEIGVEPLFARFTKPFAAEAAGGVGILKYNLLSYGRWVPFWDAGAGLLWTNLAPRIPEQSTPVNFVVETGPGMHYFVTKTLAATAGVRYHHFSNGDTGQRNIGLNAALAYCGVSWFFP